MDYKNRRLLINNIYVPFNDYEYITIPKRSVTSCYFRVLNPEIKPGYLPRLEPTPGVFMGEALITNCKGKGFLHVFNTTEETIELVVPSLTLQPFQFAIKNSDCSEKRTIN